MAVCGGLLLVLILVVAVVWWNREWWFHQSPKVPQIQVQIRQVQQDTEGLAGLSVKERLQLGLPIEYIGDSGEVELLDPSDAWYAVISMQLLTTRAKR